MTTDESIKQHRANIDRIMDRLRGGKLVKVWFR